MPSCSSGADRSNYPTHFSSRGSSAMCSIQQGKLARGDRGSGIGRAPVSSHSGRERASISSTALAAASRVRAARLSANRSAVNFASIRGSPNHCSKVGAQSVATMTPLWQRRQDAEFQDVLFKGSGPLRSRSRKRRSGKWMRRSDPRDNGLHGVRPGALGQGAQAGGSWAAGAPSGGIPASSRIVSCSFSPVQSRPRSGSTRRIATAAMRSGDLQNLDRRRPSPAGRGEEGRFHQTRSSNAFRRE